jgi:hypothetical protein
VAGGEDERGEAAGFEVVVVMMMMVAVVVVVVIVSCELLTTR